MLFIMPKKDVRVMKNKLTTYYCMNKECDWKETTHKILDGIKCPKCNGPVLSTEAKENKL